MKKKYLIIIFIFSFSSILVGILCLLLLDEPAEKTKESVDDNRSIEEMVDFKTNKNVNAKNNTKFGEMHVFESYYIDDFKLEKDKKNNSLAIVKFTLNSTTGIAYPITGVSFTFIFEDGSKSKTFHTKLENGETVVEYTVLDKVIDAVDYEFSVYQLDSNGEG